MAVIIFNIIYKPLFTITTFIIICMFALLVALEIFIKLKEPVPFLVQITL